MSAMGSACSAEDTVVAKSEAPVKKPDALKSGFVDATPKPAERQTSEAQKPGPQEKKLAQAAELPLPSSVEIVSASPQLKSVQSKAKAKATVAPASMAVTKPIPMTKDTSEQAQKVQFKTRAIALKVKKPDAGQSASLDIPQDFGDLSYLPTFWRAAVTNAFVDGVNVDLPFAHRAAISRVNEIRAYIGQPCMIYDHTLTVNAQKHTDYYCNNLRDGNQISYAHYEDRSNKYSTKEGDEICHSNGIAGGDDPVEGLDQLLNAPYHRLQYMKPGNFAIGVANSCHPRGNITVIPTKAVEQAVATPKALQHVQAETVCDATRFSIYPPPNFPNACVEFASEWPDPRPADMRDKMCGCLIHIQMLQTADKQDYTGCECALRDETDAVSLAVRYTDPAHPAHPTMPAAELKKVYGPQSNYPETMFTDNCGCVFVLPVEVLQRGHKITVDLTLKFKSKPAVHIKWTFNTIPVTRWLVQATPKDDWNTLAFAKRCAIPGDALQLSPGVHPMGRANVGLFQIYGSGVDQTTIKLLPRKDAGESQSMFVVNDPGFTCSDLTFDLTDLGDENHILYMVGDGTAVISRCRFVGGSSSVKLFNMFAHTYPAATLEFRDCDFTQYSGQQFGSVSNTGAENARGLITIAPDCKFGPKNPKMFVWNNSVFEERNSRTVPATWDLHADAADSDGLHNVQNVLEHEVEGDVMKLAAGTFIFSDHWLKSCHMVGSGVGKTIIAGDGDESFLAIITSCVWIEDCTIDATHCQGAAACIAAEGKVRFSRCKFIGCAAVQCSGQVEFDNCDLTALGDDVGNVDGLCIVRANCKVAKGVPVSELGVQEGSVDMPLHMSAASAVVSPEKHHAAAPVEAAKPAEAKPVKQQETKPQKQQEPRTWQVSPKGKTDDTLLGPVLTKVGQGDIIKIAAGSYNVASLVRFDKDITIEGEDFSTTIIKRTFKSKRDRLFNIGSEAHVTITGCTLMMTGVTETALFWVEGSLLLKNCKVISTQDRTFEAAHGSSVVFDSCDYTEFAGDSVGWLQTSQDDGETADASVKGYKTNDYGEYAPLIEGLEEDIQVAEPDDDNANDDNDDNEQAPDQGDDAEPREWLVAVKPKGDQTTLEDALGNAGNGDTVIIEAGTFVWDECIIVQSDLLIVRGAGAGKTILKRTNLDSFALLFLPQSNVTFENVTFDWSASQSTEPYFEVQDGAQLNVNNSTFKGSKALLAHLAAGSVTTLTQCDLVGYTMKKLAEMDEANAEFDEPAISCVKCKRK
eukprot:TRINITY_DN7083_c0_g1_i1.p1 TRINITY_DN7083_c0_g1~~TRINITY_DN7083_c0_g1_i1.p1  ORF type:complete len:1255 (-),score=283.49 TRINITY_DN7083_c0_g1_i1:81-3845(-)